MAVKVLVVDDHPVVAAGIANSIRTSAVDVELIGTVGVVANIESEFAKDIPDVLVSEVRLGHKDALKSIERLRENYPNCPVIIFSSADDTTSIARAAALDCHDYILKTQDCKALIDQIRSASSGQPRPENSLLIKTKSKLRRNNYSNLDIPLTNREVEVLTHVSTGLSNREVGKSLGISVETVKEHVQNILRKLDVNDRTQAAVWAVKRGVV